jgi:putative aminopeptidase FrvX
MKRTIAMDRVLAFLVGLLNTPSPTGYHEEAIAYIEKAFAALNLANLSMTRNTKGALIATLAGSSASAPRALSGHVDTLGAMVREVKSNGRLLMTQLGGYAWNAVESENVTVHAVRDGRRYRGTIQTVNPSPHTSDQMREGKREEERMEVRLDARATTREQTQALGIDVGDFVFLDPRVEITDTGYIKSRHLDDKAGVAALYGVLLSLAELGLAPAQRITFFVSIYEEVGHGASVGIPRDVVELLVIDMAASTTGEHQNSDEYSVGVCAKDSDGPYDLAVRRRLTRLCEDGQIPYKVDTYPRYGSDGGDFLRAGGDVRVGLIGPGLDASHGYERTHRDSLEATVQLALEYVLQPDVPDLCPRMRM